VDNEATWVEALQDADPKSDPANAGLGRPNRDYVPKALLASGFLSLAIALPLYVPAADPAAGTPVSAPTTLPDAGELPVEATLLEPEVGDPPPEAIATGEQDRYFVAYTVRDSHLMTGAHWFHLAQPPPVPEGESEVVLARSGLDQQVELWGRKAGNLVRLPLTGTIPKFGGAEEKEFALPAGLDAAPLYARVIRLGRAVTDLQFSASTLRYLLKGASAHAWIIDMAFGALVAMGLSALLIRLVLKDQIYPLYGCVFLLQALYLAYFSGQGFTWPLLSWARPFANYAYNVPVALSAAVAALFVREFANLKIFSPRIYSAFGWLAVAFGVLTVSNVLRVFGFGVVIARIGDLMFVGSAILTLVVAFLAWRRGGNRAAGWFLIAWSLLCIFQIATAVRLLYTRADSAEGIVYYGLAPSMVAAAVLIALGVSDHVRQQSLALTDAERRAQTDPLTGVLNRRSLIERLDSACLRAEARKLPISVLFLDLDHFKQINDSYGHAAGDACLAGIIPPIQSELRQSDVIGRYGGEEFVVILYGADAAAARPIAERICRRVADIRIEGFGGPIELTCSIGVAASDTLRVWGQHLIAHADTAVYAAKRSGRNQVQLAAALPA
jgi:diguanylate cyclase (GGDEF)-like protein